MQAAPEATGDVVTLEPLSVSSNPRTSSASLIVTVRPAELISRLPVCATGQVCSRSDRSFVG